MRRAVAGGAVLQELAERHAGHVDQPAVAHDEVHRHVERPLDVVLEAGVAREDEGQQAAAGAVGIGPDVPAEGHVAVELAVADRRVGEHRGEHRRQPHATRIFGMASRSLPKSMLTCTVAVCFIIRWPSVPTLDMYGPMIP